MTQKIAKTLSDVRNWIKNNEHHIVAKLNHRPNGEYDAVHLSGNGVSLKIPKALWERCKLRASSKKKFMYEWDEWDE